MNTSEKKYDNLDLSFNLEKSDIEKRFEQALEGRKTLFPEVSKSETKISKKSKGTRVSIYLPEDEANFAKFLRNQISDPMNDFFPTISDIYRAGLEYIKNLETNEVSKTIKKFS